MCEWCFKHGDGGKWYNNARLYRNELADEYNAREYLDEQWKNMETQINRFMHGPRRIPTRQTIGGQ